MLQITKLGVGIIDDQWSEQRLNGDSVDSRYLDISTARETHARLPYAGCCWAGELEGGYNTAATSGCYLHTAGTCTNMIIYVVMEGRL